MTFKKQDETSNLVIDDICQSHSRSPMSSQVILLLKFNSPCSHLHVGYLSISCPEIANLAQSDQKGDIRNSSQYPLTAKLPDMVGQVFL